MIEGNKIIIEEDNIKVIQGDFFSSRCHFLVNPVNCMGEKNSYLSVKFDDDFPVMAEKYKSICLNKTLKVGRLCIVNEKDKNKCILIFPITHHWMHAGSLGTLELGLEKFINTYKERRIDSIAFPLSGFGADKKKALHLMFFYLKGISVRVEIYV